MTATQLHGQNFIGAWKIEPHAVISREYIYYEGEFQSYAYRLMDVGTEIPALFVGVEFIDEDFARIDKHDGTTIAGLYRVFDTLHPVWYNTFRVTVQITDKSNQKYILAFGIEQPDLDEYPVSFAVPRPDEGFGPVYFVYGVARRIDE